MFIKIAAKNYANATTRTPDRPRFTENSKNREHGSEETRIREHESENTHFQEHDLLRDYKVTRAVDMPLNSDNARAE